MKRQTNHQIMAVGLILFLLGIAVPIIRGDSITEWEAKKKAQATSQSSFATPNATQVATAATSAATRPQTVESLNSLVDQLQQQMDSLRTENKALRIMVTKLTAAQSKPASEGASRVGVVVAPPAFPFKIEDDALSLTQRNGRWQVRLTNQGTAPLVIKDVLVDGHAAKWVTSSQNQGLVNMMGPKQPERPLNEVAKGQWVIIMSDEMFTTIDVVTDKVRLQTSIDEERWRH